jgi:beta-lactamase superfamily II metal-dependent hydrolase
MRNRSLLLLVAALSGPAIAVETPTSDEAPAYLDDQGEEIFGPDYLPLAPSGKIEPLLVGQPKGGAQVSADLANLPQSEFRRSLPDAAATPFDAPRAGRLPLLRAARLRAGAARWTGPAMSLDEPSVEISDAPDAEMFVHVVYVGQGAGAILEFPCGIAVIDSGGEYNSGDNGGRMFVDYLEKFFDARPQLNRTIDVLFTSHPHKDHLFGLALMQFGTGTDNVRIRNIVDNGQTGTSGSLRTQSLSRDRARDSGAQYSAVEVSGQQVATGVTNNVIDPIKCATVDPKLTAFWGGRNEAIGAGAPATDRYSTPNNHSVVVRVDFGAAKFLFLGDLQLEGIADMLAEYEDNLGVFDVDVFLSSHHGAENGTSEDLLRIMSPKLAVISMGDRSSQKPSTAYDHGHPRLATIRDMQDAPDRVSMTRTPVKFWGAEGQEQPFKPITIKRAIYGTGWEGTLVVNAKASGQYTVVKP